MASLNHDSRIIVVGSGVFGISTALWLAKTGYKDVTVLDMQDTAAAGYDPGAGIDSASADINKIVRFSYGTEIEYQRLASEAAKLWDQWNRELAAAPESGLPPAMREWKGEGEGPGGRKLWWNVGYLRMAVAGEFSRHELATLENMEKDGLRDTQFRNDLPEDIERARRRGWGDKLDPCRFQERLGVHKKATLDSSAGFVVAYKSCAWAKYLAEAAGVKFELGPERGRVVKIHSSGSKSVVETADGKRREADLVVVSGGGWTPSLLPETRHLLETTAGSVATIKIPKSRRDLWDRFGPENFPVVSWGVKDEKGIYSFPRDENGVLKIGYRGTKWTNYDDVDGHRLSVPKTAHVTEKKETNIPIKALDGVKEYISTHFPELTELGIASTKLCWYTDSIDNSFLVDRVPGRPGVVVCSGGSGHGFKFLPILGREVVKILEGEPTVYARMWSWRDSHPRAGRNGLQDGEKGPRVLGKQRMATEADWTFGGGSGSRAGRAHKL